ncbi:stranded RNA-specific editase 1 [Seminavis robusta]|uniref:tRNA-specific adenosine deaminase 1 n=1 Tax=Seminavis robusta TaxID=568900 RepID=A0A9N8H6D0_9STRA|nr:stranded RNA-specific editase 1 [Seminavis robusta]|eukprot:Sro108_g054320.1 stranded RNA-specific editase 1 (547) ;mRNA; r:98624-100264
MEDESLLLLSDKIAKCALDHYQNVLPTNKGKPKDNEWTVYAAMVATFGKDDMWVVSCATGTKCATFITAADDHTTKEELARAETAIVRDCHAEALARRGLVHVLWKELQQLMNNVVSKKEDSSGGTKEEDDDHNNPQRKLLELTQKAPQQQFQLRSGIQLHLYISDSPCGDASIYPLQEEPYGDGGVNNFTGAKIIVSENTRVNAADCGGRHQLLHSSSATNKKDHNNNNNTHKNVVARENVQLLGKLRTKSGRSNLTPQHRTSCMSCSDKLVRWSILGLQGSVLSRFLPNPIRLASIVVSQDPRCCSKQDCQQDALDRATKGRVMDTWKHLQQSSQQQLEPQESPTTNKHPYHLDDDDGPTVAIVARKFQSGKAAMEFHHLQSTNKTNGENSKSSSEASGKPHNSNNKKRKRDTTHVVKKASPCGMSLTWDQTMGNDKQNNNNIELIVGARGICQGKKPKQLSDYTKLASRLSRYKILEMAQSVVVQLASAPTTTNTREDEPVTRDSAKQPCSYRQWKQDWGDATAQKIRKIVFSGGPLNGWLTS